METLFYVFATGAVLSACMCILQRNPISAVMWLVATMFSVAGIFLLLEAQFIATAQVLVYAGAVMVLFLFVIMLLGAEQLSYASKLPWQRPLAIGLGVILFAEAVYIVLGQRGLVPIEAPLAESFGSPVEIGGTLFMQYLLPFEITSVLLLVAIIGAIVLTKTEKK